MKPVATNNLSVLGLIGLILLFSIPDVGLIAMILFAIFARGVARTLARAFLILTIIGVIILAALAVYVEFNFPFDDGGVEVFRYISGLIG